MAAAKNISASRATVGIAMMLCVGVAVAQKAVASDTAMPVSTPGSASTSAATVSLDAPAAGEALRIYGRMGDFLAVQQTFFVELASTTTISGAGKTKQNGGLSRVWYRRPDHVVWTTQSNISASALAIDGNNCTLFLPALSRYMVTPVKGRPDAQIAAMSAPYGMLVTSLFSSNTSASLNAVLTGAPRLQRDDFVLGVLCSHLKLPTRAGEVDLWLSQGPIPMPVKISSSMNIPASPGEDNAIEAQTEVSFRWRINVELPDSTFQLKLPDTAKRVDKLGSPVVVAKLEVGAKTSKRDKQRAGKSHSSSRAEKHDSSKRSFKLAYEPPPNIDSDILLPSALNQTPGGTLPSLSDDDAIVKAAIQGSKPDSVPSGASYQPARESTAPPPPSSSAKTPGIRLRMLNGQTVNLASYRGKKAVVLDFWATWCGPCKQSMPIVAQAAQAYRGQNVQFFAVNMAEDAASVQKFIRQQGLSIPVAMDSNGQIASAFGVTGIPHLVIIGRDGTVKGTHTGADPKLQQSLMRDLNVALR